MNDSKKIVLPVSVCIPVRNEEANLPGCLAALGSAFDEVVVVDSGSTDATRSLAEAAGAVVVEFVWDGRFPKKRNWTLRNYTFRNPWVLFLDADERVTEAFLKELAAVLPTTGCVGFWMCYENWFMDRPLRHGDTFRKLALFKVGAGEYEAFPEEWWSHLDMEVHEHPVLQGSVGELQERLEHRDYKGLKHYIAKHNEYSTWEVGRYFWLHGKAQSEQWAALTGRQRFKYKYLDRWWLGWLYFGVSYVAKRGFMDGAVGWVFAQMKRRYFAEVRLKIMERWRKEFS